MTDEKRGGASGAETSDIAAPEAPGRKRRMTAKRTQEVALRGEPLETVAREVRVTVAALSAWRDSFLEAGAVGLKSRLGTTATPGSHICGRSWARSRWSSRVKKSVRGTDFQQERAAPREDRAHEGGPPFGPSEIEAMSTVLSISGRRRYGLSRVCRVWGVTPAGIYREIVFVG